MKLNREYRITDKDFMKGRENMEETKTTEALLRAIFELIEKCKTIEELRESVKRIMTEN